MIENVNMLYAICVILFLYLPIHSWFKGTHFLSDIEGYSISWHHLKESTIHRINSWRKYVDLRKCEAVTVENFETPDF